MNAVKLFFPGEYEDGFVYMGHFFALTVNQTLRIVNIERLLQFLDERFEASFIYRYLFRRNDWLTSEQYLHIAADREVRRIFDARLGELAREPIEIPPDMRLFDEFEISIPSSILFDMNIYAKRLYIGANTGLYHWDLSWEGNTVTPRFEPLKRLDARCIHTTAKNGAVSASCGDDGLHIGIDDFDWQNRSNRLVSSLKQYSSLSVRTAWLGPSFTNYESTAQPPALFRTSKEKLKSGAADNTTETSVITDVIPESRKLDYLFAPTLERKNRTTQVEIEFIYNTDNHVFLQTSDGQFRILKLKDFRTGEKDPVVDSTIKRISLPSEILSINTTRTGTVIETYDRVVFLDDFGTHVLLDEKTISVRTFMQSQHFQQLVAVTTENGIYLICVTN